MNERQEKYSNLTCKSNHDLPAFLDPALYASCFEDNEWDVSYIEEDGELIASWIIFKKQKLSFEYVTMPQLLKYSGLYFFKDVDDKESTILNLIRNFDKMDEWIQNLYPFALNYEYELALQFETSPAYTYVIANQNLDDIWENLTSDYRNNKIKKAKKSLEITSEISLEEFYRVNEMSFRRQDLEVPYSLDYLRKLDDYWDEKNQKKIFAAIDQKGNIHSVAYLVWDKHRSYLLMAGDDPELRKSGSGIYLTWELIKFSFENLKVEKFDFLGSMIPSVEKVRINFGAKREYYPVLKQSNNRLLKLLKQVKDRVV